MTRPSREARILIEVHRFVADACCESVWRTIKDEGRTRSDTVRMLHEAHAACYHIAQVGTTGHVARCEWLLSRAYASANVGERALFHAERALELSEHPDVDDATRALCLDACAKAHDILGHPVDADYCRQESLLAAGRIANEEDRRNVVETIHSTL